MFISRELSQDTLLAPLFEENHGFEAQDHYWNLA